MSDFEVNVVGLKAENVRLQNELDKMIPHYNDKGEQIDLDQEEMRCLLEDRDRWMESADKLQAKCDHLRAALEGAIKYLDTLVTKDEGNGAFARCMPMELGGFGGWIDEVRLLIPRKIIDTDHALMRHVAMNYKPVKDQVKSANAPRHNLKRLF